MIVPLALVSGSLALVALSVLPGLSDLLALGLPSALASLYLVVRARQARPARVENWIIVDGSNVMHWQDNTPRLSTLRAVVARLTDLGFTPGVVFDANAGYKIGDRYQHDGALGRLLGLPADRVLVAPKGTPADPLVLASARDLGARIVSNDRFRDWSDAHPEVADPGHLIRGGYVGGKLWLDLDPAPAAPLRT